jgi:hypothetical protein
MADRFTWANSRSGHNRKPGRPPGLKPLFRAIVAVTVIASGLVALPGLVGQAARAAATPTVTGVSPSVGTDSGGRLVTITGTDFTNATNVQVGTATVNFTVDSDTQITTVSPSTGTDGTVDITVTTPDGTSPATPADQFTYVPTPTVTSVSPDLGPIAGGTTITITGSAFTGATAVTFWQTTVNGTSQTPATSFTVDSDTQITAVAPPAPGGIAGEAEVQVSIPAGGSMSPNSDEFIWAAPPVVQAFQPPTGSTVGGNQVAIFGSGFTGATAVSFGSAPATSFRVLAGDEIFATAPAHAPGGVSVSVTTPGGTGSSGLRYTYIAPKPTVTGVSPNSGPTAGGNPVTITGTGFTGASKVSFGTIPAANFTVNSDTSITVTAPPGLARTIDVTVTTLGSTSDGSAADEYTYLAPACTTTVTGTNPTPLSVTSGLTCLVNATQDGQITVAPGAGLSVTGSTIHGTVTATSPSEVIYCGSTEDGGLSVTGAAGVVALGGTLSDNTPCGVDTIPSSVTVTGATAPVMITGLHENGTLTLDNDTAGITVEVSNIDGAAHVENNTAPAPAVIALAGNTVNGSLYCTGNQPAPSDEGGNFNTVSGTATDQCAAISER